ncbi:MAG: hypothetical protein IT301_01535 [Dehalococcoidia bacterium]|nr:hypothetical protein [Dehalococcoidia bacterium]
MDVYEFEEVGLAGRQVAARLHESALLTLTSARENFPASAVVESAARWVTAEKPSRNLVAFMPVAACFEERIWKLVANHQPDHALAVIDAFSFVSEWQTTEELRWSTSFARAFVHALRWEWQALADCIAALGCFATSPTVMQACEIARCSTLHVEFAVIKASPDGPLDEALLGLLSVLAQTRTKGITGRETDRALLRFLGDPTLRSWIGAPRVPLPEGLRYWSEARGGGRRDRLRQLRLAVQTGQDQMGATVGI